MRKLIKADLRRILKKKSIWFTFVFMILMVTIVPLVKMSKAPDKDFAFTVGSAEGISYVALLLGLSA